MDSDKNENKKDETSEISEESNVLDDISDAQLLRKEIKLGDDDYKLGEVQVGDVNIEQSVDSRFAYDSLGLINENDNTKNISADDVIHGEDDIENVPPTSRLSRAQKIAIFNQMFDDMAQIG